MKNILYSYLLCVIVLIACGKKEEQIPTQPAPIIKPPVVTAITGKKLAISLGGNSFITANDASFSEKIDDSGSSGLTGWTSPNTITSIYFKVVDTGSINLFLVARVDAGYSSDIKVSVADQVIVKKLTNSGLDTISIGQFALKTKGYVKVDLQGATKSGANYGTVTDLVLQGTKVTNSLIYVKDNLTQHYYWGRRGPSVHLGYTLPSGVGNVQWFYNEVTVPVGQDAIGSYIMSNGFDGGYFGMQVKSTTERWILFSVWDPSNGLSTATKAGTDVTTQRFGGEGTGGQAFKVYNWKAGNTYKFLTQALPDGTGNTLYSAWFYAPEQGSWSFMATWKRPETSANKYLTGLYSFLENFTNTKGYLGRTAEYGNTWIASNTGVWTELNTARFTGDDIAKINFRQDYAGGLKNNRFYLQNGGFFNDNVTLSTSFTRPLQNVAPVIDFNNLP